MNQERQQIVKENTRTVVQMESWNYINDFTYSMVILFFWRKMADTGVRLRTQLI